MHKYVTKRQPSSFLDFFNSFPFPNRTKGFHEDKLESTFLSQFPTYQLPKIWNSTFLANKLIESHKVFKKEVYEDCIIKYPPAFKCKSRTCPDCRKI